MKWAISLLAIIIDGFGVMNTMIMSVFERTREIGVLRALGWRRSRIIGMILGETLLLAFTGFAVGSLLGIAGVYCITAIPTIGTFMTSSFGASAFLIALAVAILLAVAGGFYPGLSSDYTTSFPP